jgi:hypothetical protein
MVVRTSKVVVPIPVGVGGATPLASATWAAVRAAA